MSAQFVRVSKFRHVMPKTEKKENCYLDVKASGAGDGNFIKASANFFSLPTTGGGGPVFVHNLEKKGKFTVNQPTLNVHKGPVVDTDWSPFNDHMIATASDDCTVKISIIPEGGLKASQDQSVSTLSGHDKKLHLVHFHPTADNVLASSAYDLTVRVWDIQQQAQIAQFSEHPDLIQSFEFNANGSLLASTCKDRQIRIFDPRVNAAATTFQGLSGGKQSRAVWMDSVGKLGAVGFDASSQRQLMVWDPRNTAVPFTTVELDQSAGAIMPFYDNDVNILFLAGKGDGGVKYFEVNNDAPFVHFIDEARSNEPQKGFARLPKRSVDTSVCELAKCLRLLNNMVEIVSFQVPRKADTFQKDIYPDTYAGVPSQSAADYASGGNAEPVLKSLAPGAAAVPAAGSGKFVAAKPAAQEIAELKATVADQAARIKELEEQIAKLSA